MDSNDFNDEIEELDENPNTTQELSDEIPEDYLDENYEESYDNSYKRPKFGEREYKNAKDENGRHDKDYYKKRSQELDEKVSKAQEEKDRDWKTTKKDDEDKDSENKKNEKKENLDHKPEEERQNKNKLDKLKDKYNLEKAKYERMQNKLDGIKARTYQTMHPVEAAKEEVKEKAKDAAKATGKAAAKGAANAAKATGRMVAAGGKAVIAFLASNPIVLAIAAVVIILFVVLFLLFSNTSDEDLDSLGYFDTTCDFNLTTVIYSCSPYETNNKDMSLKDYVIGVAYGESEEERFSEAALKALMIIVKTNALAEGNYDNSVDKIVRLNTCDVIYEDPYEELPDEEENEAKKDKVKILEQYYNEIDNFLFISDSYKSEITTLGEEDILEYNDDVIEKLVETDKNGYEEILQEIYAVDEDEKDETITIENDKPYLFIGDSRTVGMRDSVSELDNNNTVAESSKEYNWFVNTAISQATEKTKDSSYNIISWLGVNDAADRSRAKKYFDKYKELAEGNWNKHTIYVVSVGPVGPTYSYTSPDGTVITSDDLNKDIDYFNDTMRQSINDAKISNLKFINLNYNITSYDTAGLHYGTDDYKKIFSDITSKIYKSKTISKTKVLFNNNDYCTYYNYNNGCDLGWWYPIGESGNFSKGAILRGDPELVDTGVDNYGWREDPFTGELAYHDASDLWAPTIGMNVIATRSGTITTAVDGNADASGANNGGACGNYIVIDHGDGYSSKYCHLKKGSVEKYSSVGMKVSQGQIIALSGNSGRTTAPHLHFGIYKDGSVVNPFDFISTDNPRPTGNCNTNNSKYSNDKEGVCKALKDAGFSNNAVAGIMGNMEGESNFDATIQAVDSNGLYSYGLIQWNGSNGTELVNYCSDKGGWQSVGCQVDYLTKYIDKSASYGSVFNAKPYIYGMYSANVIAQQFCLKLERCEYCIAKDMYGNETPGSACIARGKRAEELLKFVQNGCKEEGE